MLVPMMTPGMLRGRAKKEKRVQARVSNSPKVAVKKPRRANPFATHSIVDSVRTQKKANVVNVASTSAGSVSNRSRIQPVPMSDYPWVIGHLSVRVM